MPRHGKHYVAIKNIGRLPLVKDLLLADVGDADEMKKTVQACYYEMKKDGLDVSVIDYLCMISTLYLAYQTGSDYRAMLNRYKTEPEEVKNFLRYFMRYPFFFLGKYNEEAFKEIAVFWYKIINEEVTKKKK